MYRIKREQPWERPLEGDPSKYHLTSQTFTLKNSVYTTAPTSIVLHSGVYHVPGSFMTVGGSQTQLLTDIASTTKANSAPRSTDNKVVVALVGARC